eukprot:3444705-Rhodomonas_salina.1
MQPQTSAAPPRLCVNVCGKPAEKGPCPKHGGPKLACSYLCYRAWRDQQQSGELESLLKL